MKIDEILRAKGRDVATIERGRTVLDAVRELVERNIGSLVVVEGRRPVGIFTERDILRLTAREPGRLGEIEVGAVMTPDPVTAGPDAELRAVMDVMTERRIRHLPVVHEGALVGIISIGDLVNAARRALEEENTHLRHYIHGAG